MTDRRRSVAEERAKPLGINADTLLGLPLELIGTLEQIVDDLVARRERYGITYITVSDRYLKDFAPVVERLSGA